MKDTLKGKTFGSLLVIKRTEALPNYRAKKNSFWLCKCQKCGEEKIRTASRLREIKTCHCEYKGLNSKYKKFNKYDLSGEYGIGYTHDNLQFYFDLEDYDKIKNYSWAVAGNGYHLVTTNWITHKQIRLHHLVYGSINGGVGFINKNFLDVRKANLRIGKHKELVRNRKIGKNNTSGIIGVYWSNREKKWIAQITIDYKTIRLGGYENFEEVVRSRLEGEKKYFGEFAPQRHLYKKYGI